MKKNLAIFALLAIGFGGMATAATPPAGWSIAGSAPTAYDMGTTAAEGTKKGWNAYIRAKPDATGFGTMMQTVDASDYRGKRVRLAGNLRADGAEKTEMWMRVDGTGNKPVAFDNMDDRPLRGTTGWTHCEIVLDVPADAKAIAFGFLLDGKGAVKADAFRMEIVGNDVAVTGAAHQPRPRQPVNLSFEP